MTRREAQTEAEETRALPLRSCVILGKLADDSLSFNDRERYCS